MAPTRCIARTASRRQSVDRGDESECDRECDWEAISSKFLVHDSDVSVDEAEVTLQESDPSIDLSQRWVLTTEPDEFDKDFRSLWAVDPSGRTSNYPSSSHCQRDSEFTLRTSV